MTFLRTLQVDYVVVRAGLYEEQARAALLRRMSAVRGSVARSDVAGWTDGCRGGLPNQTGAGTEMTSRL